MKIPFKHPVIFKIVFCLFVFSFKSFAQSPDKIYQDLFTDVQLKPVFKDSKTFVDCVPLFPSDSILADYHRQKNTRDFDLHEFVIRHFELPDTSSSGFKSDTARSVFHHADTLWNFLVHTPGRQRNPGSLIPLPYPYVVPGGRFREIYYWDSFFTMLGLKVSHKENLIRQMTDNFAWLIDTFGFVPNGNRTYYLTRSQPPFFSLMVELLSEIRGDSVFVHYLPQLEKEYSFWMKGSEMLASSQPEHRNVVLLDGKYILNRYWDQDTTPRPESFREDYFLGRNSGAPTGMLFRNIRAACESGWDFSTRWFQDGKTLRTIHTTEIIPVDLNALIYHLEITLQKAYHLKGDTVREKKMALLAQKRRKAIQLYCWNKTLGYFMDYDFRAGKNTSVYSLAGMFPLYFKLATPVQAKMAAQVIRKKFLRPGGLVTTPDSSGQQWDAPNGWAPLQWISIQGLKNYKYFQLANEITKRWIGVNSAVFKNTGKMMEKYNVENLHLKSGGGEYPTQDGFGWTNGVLLDLETHNPETEYPQPLKGSPVSSN